MKQRIFVGILAAAAAIGLAATVQASRQQSQGRMLGTIRLPTKVLANGQPLAAGSYQVRITGEDAQPPAAGASPNLEQWVEFLQRGQVKGREVASIVPDAEMEQLQGQTSRRPKPGTTVVELLKGGNYVRVWINRDGNNYLIHLPPA